MTDEISREALDRKIATLKRQLAAAEAMRAAMYGDTESESEAQTFELPPVQNQKYQYLKPWHAVRKYLREHGPAEFCEIYDALILGSSTIRNASNPPWSYSKAIHRKMRDGTFLINGQIRAGKDDRAGKSDIISLNPEAADEE